MTNSLQRPWLASLVAGIALGASTAAMAASDRAFVPMGTADAAGIIDLERQEVISTVTGTLNTHGSALTPDGQQLILGSLTPHEPGTEIARPEGVTEDEHAAHHGDGGTVSREAASTGLLYVADTVTSQVVRTLEVPGPVHHVLVTQDGRHAVSTHPMGGGISVVSLDSGQVIASVATGPNPNYLVQNEEGGSIFVSNAGNGTISEVDPQHWFVRRNMRVGGSPEHMVLSNDGERLYVNDDTGGRALALDLASASGSVAAEYEIGAAPHGIDLSPDGQTLYATSQGDNRLVTYSLEDGTRHSTDLAPAPYHLAVAPSDGRVLITSRANPVLWILAPDSLEVLKTVELGGIGHQISLEASHAR
ncbi:beta-propeller fold lactonase family protein [Modicisalibacter coralii]|uniref:beta-propeller fold lactonase family protein n=1 Tax=Modicisalibacter coralii TaxID=2304602 RepID=UPI00100BE91E|nr:beta-propeller fold lactonase family protein [Halomonas coralii]